MFWKFHYWKTVGTKKINLLLLNLSNQSQQPGHTPESIYLFQQFRPPVSDSYNSPGLDNPHGVSISNPMIRVPRLLFSLNSKGRLPFFFLLYIQHLLPHSHVFIAFHSLLSSWEWEANEIQEEQHKCNFIPEEKGSPSFCLRLKTSTRVPWKCASRPLWSSPSFYSE